MPQRDLPEDIFTWSSVRFRQWLNAWTEDTAPRSVNWWLGAKVIPQHHAYDQALSADERREWAAVMLLLIRRAERFAGYDRWNAAADEFNLRSLLIEQLGSVPDDETWNLGALGRDALAALTLTSAQAAGLAQRRQTLPLEQIRLLRRHKMLLNPLVRLADQLPAGPDAEAVREWLSVRPSLP